MAILRSGRFFGDLDGYEEFFGTCMNSFSEGSRATFGEMAVVEKIRYQEVSKNKKRMMYWYNCLASFSPG